MVPQEKQVFRLVKHTHLEMHVVTHHKYVAKCIFKAWL